MVFKMDTFGDVYLFGDKCNVVKKILITAIKNEKNDLVIVDFANIKQITPTSANTIFGNLLVEAGISKFNLRKIYTYFLRIIFNNFRYK